MTLTWFASLDDRAGREMERTRDLLRFIFCGAQPGEIPIGGSGTRFGTSHIVANAFLAAKDIPKSCANISRAREICGIGAVDGLQKDLGNEAASELAFPPDWVCGARVMRMSEMKSHATHEWDAAADQRYVQVSRPVFDGDRGLVVFVEWWPKGHFIESIGIYQYAESQWSEECVVVMFNSMAKDM
jgi:hypothetical protein